MASGATTVVDYSWIEDQMKTKLRAGVDKGRPITSVADSVKKFGGAGATEVKRSTVPAKPKQNSPAHVKPDDKHTTAKKPSVAKPSPPAKPRVAAHHDKPDAHAPKHSHGHAHHPHPSKDHTHHPHPSKDHTHHPHPHHHPHHHPHKPDASSKSVKVTHKKPHHHAHGHAHTAATDKKESEKQEKKMEEEKKTEEVTISTEEPKPGLEPEPVAPPAEPEPPSEQPKSEAPPADAKPSEKREEETTIQQLEKDTTRAQRVISLFENKGSNKPEQEQAPVWKTSAQQQRAARDLEEREKEMARQKEQEQQQQQQEEKEKEKAEVAEDKTRTSSNASSHKDEPVVVNGSAETTSAESANDEKEATDGGMISKAKGLAPSSSNVTKSTSALPSATKNTSNKNDEIKIRDNKMKKAGSSTTTIQDPKKRLMVEEAKGKRSSWAAPKREECAVCGKVVYVMERLEADKIVYHKTCFKCTVCNKTLSTGTYAALQGKIYCKVHFKQLFKMKGNYDEGFGREQHKTKWLKKDQLDGESEA